MQQAINNLVVDWHFQQFPKLYLLLLRLLIIVYCHYTMLSLKKLFQCVQSFPSRENVVSHSTSDFVACLQVLIASIFQTQLLRVLRQKGVNLGTCFSVLLQCLCDECNRIANGHTLSFEIILAPFNSFPSSLYTQNQFIPYLIRSPFMQMLGKLTM